MSKGGSAVLEPPHPLGGLYLPPRRLSLPHASGKRAATPTPLGGPLLPPFCSCSRGSATEVEEAIKDAVVGVDTHRDIHLAVALSGVVSRRSRLGTTLSRTYEWHATPITYHEEKLGYRGAWVGTLGAGSPSYGAGRTCEEPGCETKLSTYNAWSRCWQHEPAHPYRQAPRDGRRNRPAYRPRWCPG